MTDLSNTTIGRYQITHLLGRGGMGEVYRATDTTLARDLALKILPQELTADATRVARFVHEARAASALNHPHLIAIYDIGEATLQQNGAAGTQTVHYIAMELVQGQTLRSIIDSKSMDLTDRLDRLAQVADGLAAAHSAGVIHRDLKPENVIFADGGYAKVLDFGVAKLRGDIVEPRGTDVSTQTVLTSEGTLVGTAGYMSPEQAQGRSVDFRTDVFSFGAVLYEAVTGARAFDGPSIVDMLHRIIHDDPPSVADRVPGGPANLERIVRRCLAKHPDERYQSMRDVAIDLRDVRRQLETTAPHASATFSRRAVVWASLAAAAVVMLSGAAWWMRSGDLQETVPNVRLQRLTASGTAIHAVMSPDGRYMAWVDAAAGRQTLRVKQLAGTREVEVVPAAPVAYWSLAFSRDGSKLFYATKTAAEPAGRLFVVEMLGGTPRLILEGIDSLTTMSPDGRQLAFYRGNYPERGATSLMRADVSGQNLRVLRSTRAPEFFVPAFFTAPSWSPDGARIAAAVQNAEISKSMLVTVDVASGEQQAFPTRYEEATFTEWLPDGSGILFIASDESTLSDSPGQVWLQPYPSGKPRRITRDLVEYRNISVRADGAAFISVGLDGVFSLWRLPLDGTEPQRLPSERYDGELGVATLPDGRIVVSAGDRGSPQLALIDRDGATRQMLTTEGANAWPAASPDGRTIAFVSNRDGRTGVWRMDVESYETRLLAHLPKPAWLSITHDGQFVVCASTQGLETSTWKLAMNGGTPVRIAPGFDRPAISPDDRLIAGIHRSSREEPFTLAIMPLDGSGPRRSLGTISFASGAGLLEWASDGDGILFSTAERANVWLQPVSGGEPVKITNLTDLALRRGDLTADGLSLIVTRGAPQNDAYLITNFR